MMRVAISGSSGLVGSQLVGYFRQQGAQVTRVVRQDADAKYGESIVRWNFLEQRIESEKLESHDVVIHLAGANIADKPWTVKYKSEISQSRIEGTAFLSQTLALLRRPPKVLLSASAVGFYGHHPSEEILDESSPQGQGFLPQLCGQWEKATQPAQGIRVIHMRFGLVLSNKGGGLAKMLPIFDIGLGGKLGNGRQMMSWIALSEIPFIILHLIQDPSIIGPVNVVSPHPVSNAEFTRILGKAIKRPTIVPVPAFAVRMMFGEMGNELLLKGARVLPARLQKSGYVFRYPDIASGLKSALEE